METPFLFEIRETTARNRVMAGDIAPDRMEDEPLDFAGRIKHGFECIAESEPQRVMRIDANQNIEAVFQDVLICVRKILETV